jgi:hypothetical protein
MDSWETVSKFGETSWCHELTPIRVNLVGQRAQMIRTAKCSQNSCKGIRSWPFNLELNPSFLLHRQSSSSPKHNSTGVEPRSHPSRPATTKCERVSRNREVPRKKYSREGTTSIPFPQRERIKQQFVAGKNISQIAKTEKRHWTTVAKIVKEQDVQEYVEDLRAHFYGALENVLIAVMQYVKNGKDGGLLGYRMLVDAGVIPRKDGKDQPAREMQKPAEAHPDSEQARITMIATEMVRRAIERHRFFGIPLPEADEVEESIRVKP